MDHGRTGRTAARGHEAAYLPSSGGASGRGTWQVLGPAGPGPSLRQNVDLGDVPAGHADYSGGALQVSGLPGDGERLRFAGEQRDVVVLPERGLQFVVAGQLLAGGDAAAHVGA